MLPGQRSRGRCSCTLLLLSVPWLAHLTRSVGLLLRRLLFSVLDILEMLPWSTNCKISSSKALRPISILALLNFVMRCLVRVQGRCSAIGCASRGSTHFLSDLFIVDGYRKYFPYVEMHIHAHVCELPIVVLVIRDE